MVSTESELYFPKLFQPLNDHAIFCMFFLFGLMHTPLSFHLSKLQQIQNSNRQHNFNDFLQQCWWLYLFDIAVSRHIRIDYQPSSQKSPCILLPRISPWPVFVASYISPCSSGLSLFPRFPLLLPYVSKFLLILFIQRLAFCGFYEFLLKQCFSACRL